MSTFIPRDVKNVLIYGLPGTGKSTAAKLEGLTQSRDTDSMIPTGYKAGDRLEPDVINAMKTAVQREGGVWFTNLQPIVSFVAEKTDWPIAYYTLASGSDQVARIEKRDGPEVASRVDGGMWVEASKALGRALSRSLPATRFVYRELAADEYLDTFINDDLSKLGILAGRRASAEPAPNARTTDASANEMTEGQYGDDEGNN